jgi:hypothetical protein
MICNAQDDAPLQKRSRLRMKKFVAQHARKKSGACKKALFYRVFCNSRLAGDLQGFYRAREGVVLATDVFTTAHDVPDACAIHIG